MLTSPSSLDLYANGLTGVIPSAIGNLVNLEGLYLASNQLSGEIPESICNIYPNLLYFQITHNQLCTPYPECIEDYVGYQDTTNCGQVSITEQILPITYELYNPYPNPFNPVTTLRYDLPEYAQVSITIYNMMGRVVKTLINNQQTAGYRSTQWNATNDAGSPVSAGIYLYTIQMELLF